MSGDAETGSNAGSDWFMNRSDDAGGYLGGALTINRATGALYLDGPARFGDNATVEGTFNMVPGPAPNAPTDGDMWVTAQGAFMRIAGVTRQIQFV